MGYAYDTDQTQICSPDTKLIRIHTPDADITLSTWTVNRCGTPWIPGEAAVVDRGSLKSGWLQSGFVVSGYALLRADVRPRNGIHYQRRMATTCTLAELQSTEMQRDCLV